MTDDKTLIFVYGTLRHAESAHDLLQDCFPVGPARTQACYTLHNMGPYPAMTDQGTTAVVGELYWIPSQRLTVLDAYEDHPRLYQRAAIQLNHAEFAVATGYLMRSSETEGFPTIPSGDWQTIQGPK